MAKRVADTQLTKEGTMTDDDGGFGGSSMAGPPRATAAQLAARRLAKPRGGRRPVTTRPPQPAFQGMQQQQSLPSPFAPTNSSNSNGTQQQRGLFGFGQQSNGNQPNQTSSSFPPFPSSSNTNITSTFTAPSSSFNFTGAQNAVVNNPFAAAKADTTPPPQSGFKGNIFNIPAEMNPFSNHQQGGQASSQPEPPKNPFDLSASQGSTNPGIPSLFSQASVQKPEQPSASVFGQSNNNKPPTSNIFGHLGTPQAQNSNNSIFQRPNALQSTGNLFAHIGAPQSSSNIFGQNSTPASTSQDSNSAIGQEGDSMMQTSPDPSPQSRPFGVLNQSNPEPQSSPTKAGTAQGVGGSLFDRITRPPPDSAVPMSPSSPIKGDNSQTDNSDLFKARASPSGFTNSALNDEDSNSSVPQANSPTKSPSSVGNRKMAKPTLSQSPAEASQSSYKNVFGGLKVPLATQSPSTAPPSVSPFSLPSASQLSGNVSSSSPSKEGPTKFTSLSPNIQTSSSKENIATGGRPFGTPPTAPADFTDDEKRELVTAYRLKALDVGMQHYIETNPDVDLGLIREFYLERKRAILAAGGLPLENLAGSKRGALGVQPNGEAQIKKARFGGSPKILGGTMSNSAELTPSLNEHSAASDQASNTNGKRSASEELTKSNINGGIENNKKVRSGDQISNPSLLSSSPSSYTSSMFKNILDNQQGPAVNGIQDAASTSSKSIGLNNFQPPSPFTNNASLSQQPEPEPKQSSTVSMPSPIVGANTSSIPGTSSLFSIKSIPSSESSFGTSKLPSSKVPTFGHASSTENSEPFSAKPASKSDSSSAAVNPPAFSVPTFGTGSSPNFLSQFGKSAEKTAEEEKKKRKAEDFDSDEEDEATWERRDAEEQRAKRMKLEESTQGKNAKIVDGKWTFVGTDKRPSDSESKAKPTESNISVFDKPQPPMTNGHNIFGHLSGEDSGAEGSKTGDADDEDDGQDDLHGNDDDDNDSYDHQAAQSEGRQFHEQKASRNPFGTRTSATASLASKNPDEPTPQANSRSLFDRISKDEKGEAVRETQKPSSVTGLQGSNIFGQNSMVFGQPRSSGQSGNIFDSPSINTSSAAGDKPSLTASTNIFGNLPSSTPSQDIFGKPPPSASHVDSLKGESPKGDNTWSPDSPIKFGTTSSAPAVNVTSPSPSKPAFTGLFGASAKKNETPETPTKPSSSIFSTTPTKTPNVGFGFGFTPSKPATSNLSLPSNAASVSTSRATSPGATTAESANESTADAEDDGAEKHEQLDLASEGPGEEEEDIIFSVKAKALIFDVETKTWLTRGVGPLRVLKDKKTGKVRMIMRQEPSGKVVLNSALLKEFKYEYTKTKTIKAPVFNEASRLENLTLKVRKEEDAEKLSEVLEANKSN